MDCPAGAHVFRKGVCTVCGGSEHLPAALPSRQSPLSPVVAQFANKSNLRDRLFGKKTERTIRVYRDDLRRFARFLGLSGDIDELAAHFLTGPDGVAANATVEAFLARLLETKSARFRKGEDPKLLSAQYVNHHLAAIRSLVKVGRKLGMIVWPLDVEKIPEEDPTRATAGPSREDVRRMIEASASQDDPAKAARDAAVLSILAGLGLRGIAVRRLDVEHADAERGTLRVIEKGKRREEARTIPPNTLARLRAWLALRGPAPGALFWALDHRPAYRGKRLTGNGFYEIVRTAGERAGVKTWPHAWRHTAITTVRGHVKDDRSAMAFSGHKKVETLRIYDDARATLQAEAATFADDDLVPAPRPPESAEEKS
jgi:integrase/recombinase XerC